jgi:hypothetical protein
MVESYVQPWFLFFTSTVLSLQDVSYAFSDLDKQCSFIDILRLHLPKEIPVRFYIYSIRSDQALIEVLALR